MKTEYRVIRSNQVIETFDNYKEAKAMQDMLKGSIIEKVTKEGRSINYEYNPKR